MTRQDNSWEALFKPGTATSYFQHNPLPTINFGATYTPATAWWMAELCRLAYRQENDELGNKATPPTRNDVLHKIGWKELIFIKEDNIQVTIVAPQTMEAKVVVFRGTDELKDWITNIKTIPTSWPEGGKVHVGFKGDFNRVCEQIVPHLTTEVPLFFTGHSLGGALATLAASRWVELAPTIYTIGCPRVGNAKFAQTIKKINNYRVVNYSDMVTEVPPLEWNYIHTDTWYYLSKAGELWVNPTEDAVKKDREQWKDFFKHVAHINNWDHPIQPLSDHAPVNYVARLERLL